jgi:hypothetical protein
MIRLLIADGHPVVGAGLRALFATEPDFDLAIGATSVQPDHPGRGGSAGR